jgi:hypothetical protein
MTKMDVQQLRKNMGYMIKALKDMDESMYCCAAKAVLEHHFDNHEHCDEWCRRKTMTPTE